MTKERRLAIQMWQEIVVKCKAGEKFNVARFKAEIILNVLKGTDK